MKRFAKPILGCLAVAFPFATAQAFDFGKSQEERFADRHCAWCHGPSLQGYTTAPRLAGQTAEYLEAQMLNFQTHSRDNPLSQQVMWGAATSVPPSFARDLSVYMATLEPEPANDGRSELEEEGRALFQNGNSAANVPSCVVCHGPEGQGVGKIPRLGGLSYPYLERRLSQWGEGYHASAMFPMPTVASKLSDGEIAALASYLSFVK
jgi:cytochrome c553